MIMKKFIKGLAFAAVCFSSLTLARAQSNLQTIIAADEQHFVKGSPDLFTGDVEVKILFTAKDDARFSAGIVSFAPGARSNWHTHPTGQHLVVLDGVGLTGLEDGTVREIKKGDVVWCPPGVKHWHGVAPNQSMTHMALTGEKDGANATWMEPVSDAQYQKR